jgi:hypothetical protein
MLSLSIPKALTETSPWLLTCREMIVPNSSSIDALDNIEPNDVALKSLAVGDAKLM